MNPCKAKYRWEMNILDFFLFSNLKAGKLAYDPKFSATMTEDVGSNAQSSVNTEAGIMTIICTLKHTCHILTVHQDLELYIDWYKCLKSTCKFTGVIDTTMLLVRFYKWSQRLHEQRNPGDKFSTATFQVVHGAERTRARQAYLYFAISTRYEDYEGENC